MDIIKTNSTFEADFMDIVRAFAPYDNGEDGEIDIRIDGGEVTLRAGDFVDSRVVDISKLSDIKKKSESKRLAKIMLYDYLSRKLNVCLPYGSLTGIRPTKLYHELTRQGVDAYQYFTDYLRVGESATRLIKRICDNQAGIYSLNDNEIDFFVNIPI